MRGRKPGESVADQFFITVIKKESPNEGTETRCHDFINSTTQFRIIKKESPNEGTETSNKISFFNTSENNKKRIPE